MRLASALLAAALLAPLAAGQGAPRAATAYKTPHTSFGHPSLEGTWLANAILPLEAPPGGASLVVSEAEAKVLAEREARAMETLPFMFLDPEVPGIYREAADTNGLAIVRGQRRSRAVVEPANGMLPLTPAARREVDQLEQYFASSRNPPTQANNMEERPAAERCLSMDAAPPVVNVQSPLPRRIVQTRDHIVIQTEQFDETRIIPFADKHGPRGRPKLVGDSIARWDGDTLVIETVNFSRTNRLHVFPTLIVAPQAKVTERLTRVSADELLYQYTVEDPATYSAPWLGEYSLYLTDKRMYEFACHEGNYSLRNIMLGQREAERRAASLR